jgi:LytS/YehU family sensor histidine kinase
MINSFLLVIYTTFLNYLLFEYAFARFRRNWKDILLGLLYILALIVLYTVGLYGWRQLWIQLHIYTDFTPDLSFPDGVAVHSQFSLASVILFAVVRNMYNNIRLKQVAQQLLVEKKEAELNYLKAQTNPHFLFNTLNNIYSLARDKSELAPESVLRLSKILRYMLYETSGDFISVEKELKIIDDYIALEKLRYDESLHITFKKDIEDLNVSIPPLLLIPLIENAFKHGVAETRNHPYIDIELSVHKQQLSFVVKNSYETASDKPGIQENIGLSNLRRQLRLLYTDYTLTAKSKGSLMNSTYLPGTQEDSEFITTLKINMSSHV